MEKDSTKHYLDISEKVFAPIYDYLTQSVIKRIPIELQNIDVLDLGGGNGRWLFSLLEKGARSGILIDIEPEMIEHAKIRLAESFSNNKWRALQGSAKSLPIDSEVCNLIVSRSSMHMWEDLEKCWKEMHRVLKEGGYVFLGRGYGPDLPLEVRNQVKANRKKFKTANVINKAEPPSPAPENLAVIAEDNGFSCIEIIPDSKAYWILAKK